MEELILWILLSYGMTNILVYGSIFKQLRLNIKKYGEDEHEPFQEFWRFLDGILSCVMCCSTWTGFFIGMILYSPTHEFLSISTRWSWFFDGVFSSGAVWAINAIVEWFEENRPNRD